MSTWHTKYNLFLQTKNDNIDPNSKQSVSYSLKRIKQIKHGTWQMELQASGHASSTQHPPSPCWRLGSNFRHLTRQNVAAQGVSATLRDITKDITKMCEDWRWLVPFPPTRLHRHTPWYAKRRSTILACVQCKYLCDKPSVLQQSTNRLNIKSVSASVSILFVKFELADWTGGEPFDEPTWSTWACLKMRYTVTKTLRFQFSEAKSMNMLLLLSIHDNKWSK